MDQYEKMFFFPPSRFSPFLPISIPFLFPFFPSNAFIYFLFSLPSKMAPSVLFSGVWVEPIHKHQTVDTGTIFGVKEKRGEKSKEREGKKGHSRIWAITSSIFYMQVS